MARLIDADALYAKLGKMAREPYYQHDGEDYYVGIADASGAVAEAPTVDAVEVVHGRWLEGTKSFRSGTIVAGHCCSVCDEFNVRNSNYCPNCGADMRERREGE